MKVSLENDGNYQDILGYQVHGITICSDCATQQDVQEILDLGKDAKKKVVIITKDNVRGCGLYDHNYCDRCRKDLMAKEEQG